MVILGEFVIWFICTAAMLGITCKAFYDKVYIAGIFGLATIIINIIAGVKHL
jgi:hypothetical protein